VGIAVASVVDLAARRAQQAARSRAESEILSHLAGSVLRGEDAGRSIPALLERVRETFAMESVALLELAEPGEGRRWRTAAAVGAHPATSPEDADVEVPAGDRLVLALGGRVLPAADRRVLVAFAAQTAALLERRRLAEQAEEARRLAEANRIRTALLAAVSHDLRTPLAGIKAAVTSLRSDEVEWSAEDEAELLAGIETGADRLNHLIGNLLDMSRLRTGSVSPLLRDIALDEVVPAALAEVPAASVRLDLPEGLPLVRADTGLLERAVANVVENAVKYSPPGAPVVVRADPLPLPAGPRVEVRVIDRGPGVPAEARDRVFEPFQRYGDAPTAGTGVGLGLAVARGFTEAMGGTLTAEDTPGGGLSMVFTLPAGGAGPDGAAVPEAGPDPAAANDPDRRKAVPER
jgi:two-component system sensor histidine kinase KdpD